MLEQPGPEMDWDGKGIDAALTGIDVSADPNHWVTHNLQHSPMFNKAADPQTYQVHGKTFRATGARYQTVVNVDEGALM